MKTDRSRHEYLAQQRLEKLRIEPVPEVAVQHNVPILKSGDLINLQVSKSLEFH